MLTISQVAKATDLSIKSIRYYEQIGLISAPPRTENDYRYYPDSLINRLRFIKKTKDAGFSLKESKELLALADNHNRKSTDVKAILSLKIEALQAKINRELVLLESLKNITDKCCGDDKPDCPIIDAFSN
ncbi:MerR family transcriptional regulator [Psychromonas sp. KJ10-10]|uniref:MerR family transcriptional regulator n=1 Tax=Psychromonas sp. KJ10-10 TaxID=3391823 RepID=UPI0039B50CFE